jgi:hypothetical protein
LRPTRRRARRTDPLASAAVIAILASLRAALPDIIPQSQEQLLRMLQAVRGLYVRPPAATRRGRPARFAREHLLRVDAVLRRLPARETSIGVRSFVGQYLPVLDFPRAVRAPLERGALNLFEAHQLARLTAERLGRTDAAARAHRQRLLAAVDQVSAALLRLERRGRRRQAAVMKLRI